VTLIAAMCCDSGVVIASDSKGTEASTGNLAVDQSYLIQKLFTLGTHFAWGATGSAGISERLDAALTADYRGSQGLYARATPQVQDRFRQVARDVVKHEIESIPMPLQQALAIGAFPRNTFVFVGWLNNGPFICEVTWDAQLSYYTQRGFHATGSAGLAALSTYAMLEHQDLRNASLEMVRVALYRVADTCIRSCAGAVGPPIQMIEVTQHSAKLLTSEELKATADTVTLWEGAEHAALRELLSG
jgi:20S proteasome alpha/beta subunit